MFIVALFTIANLSKCASMDQFNPVWHMHEKIFIPKNPVFCINMAEAKGHVQWNKPGTKATGESWNNYGRELLLPAANNRDRERLYALVSSFIAVSKLWHSTVQGD